MGVKIKMVNEWFSYYLEDDGYCIRNESNHKIIATGLKLEEAQNLTMYMNVLEDENKSLTFELNHLKEIIYDASNHQKTRPGQKALQDVIKEYNDYLLGHEKKGEK